jgi:trigger factor
MEITRENTGEQTATLKIELAPADYLETINKVLKDYQRKATIPGFRPGHVPFGLVQKMYGSAVFADEVNKIVSEKLYGYIQDNKIEVLGQPLPNLEKTPVADWLEQKNIEFYFDLGIAPEFDVKLDESITVDYYDIAVDDAMIDKYMADMRDRHGVSSSPENAGENDSVFGEFVELDSEGNAKENGLKHSASLKVSVITDEKVRKALLAAKVTETLDFNPMKATGDADETARLLGVKKEEAEVTESEFRFTVNSVSHVEPAELNEDFYEKVYPGSDIKDLEAFREKMKNEAQTAYVGSSDHLFSHHSQEALLESLPVALPHDFMKRWLLSANEGKLSAEEIEANYDKYTAQMKWQLIENKLIRDNNIDVSEDEIKAYVKDYYLPGWQTAELTPDLTERLEAIANGFIEKNKEESRRILDAIFDRKINALIKEKVKLNHKTITYEEFMALDAEKH